MVGLLSLPLLSVIDITSVVCHVLGVTLLIPLMRVQRRFMSVRPTARLSVHPFHLISEEYEKNETWKILID